MNTEKLTIAPMHIPRVLLVGNGLLKLNGTISWEQLIRRLNPERGTGELHGIPFAMQPEVMLGADVEETQRRIADVIDTGVPHELLKTLVHLEFDAIITTNYTYEIEAALSGKNWTAYQQKKAQCFLHDSHHVRHNTCLCNLVQTKEGRQVPVFHIHGDKHRRHSLVLSYYSYASHLYRLIGLNKERGNVYEECRQEERPIEVWSWLDYFLLGEVHAVGFGFDFSEFDIWWAIERKAREHARHGALHIWHVSSSSEWEKTPLAQALQAQVHQIAVNQDDYATAYETVVRDVRRLVNEDDSVQVAK